MRLTALVKAHLDAGGVLYTGVLTLSHGPLDAVRNLLDALDAGRSAAVGRTGGSRWAKDRKDFGVEGTAWHREEVHGRNGWHVHTHLLIFAKSELDAAQLGQLQKRLYGRHRDAVQVAGFHTLEAFNRLQAVRTPDALPHYLTKSDGARAMADRVAAEATRGDVKSGKGRTPGELLEAFVETGDTLELNRWRDLEAATVSRRWRHLPAKLVKLYGIGDAEPDLDDLDDLDGEVEDRADAVTETGGVEVMRVDLMAWKQLTRTLGAVGQLRQLVHVGDLDAAQALVDRAHRVALRRAPDRPREPSGAFR